MNVVLTLDGQEMLISARQAAALDVLNETNKGGFARVHSYEARSNRIVPEVADISFLSRFSYEKLLGRRIKALQAIKLKDIKADAEKDSVLSELSAPALALEFKNRKAFEIASMRKTLDGVRDDAHRQGHDRCYAKVCDGVKVHFITETGKDKKKYPVLSNGLPQVESIMVQMIEVSRNVITPGRYKSSNPGVGVRLSNIMQGKLPKATKIATLSLKDDNFAKLVIDGNTVLPADIAGDFT